MTEYELRPVFLLQTFGSAHQELRDDPTAKHVLKNNFPPDPSASLSHIETVSGSLLGLAAIFLPIDWSFSSTR